MAIPRNLLQGRHVLVVDDEIDSLEVASSILHYYGARVTEAFDGREALAVIGLHNPDLIISDISMPGMDGWSLIYELKQNPSTSEIPVVALTAHAMIGDRERVINAGFHNYLTKPLTPATFLRDLLALLADIPVFAQLMAEANA